MEVTNAYKLVSAHDLSRIFTKRLRAVLGESALKEVYSKNRKERTAGVCHSHDFCDANVVMAEAMEELGLAASVDHPDCLNLWNSAWDLFKDRDKNYSDFPDIRIPDFLSGPEWSDGSWRNDACARSQMNLTADQNGPSIVVWVAQDNPKERECDEWPKYSVQVHTTADELLGPNGFVLNTNYKRSVIKTVRTVKKVFQDGGVAALASWIKEHEVAD